MVAERQRQDAGRNHQQLWTPLHRTDLPLQAVCDTAVEVELADEDAAAVAADADDTGTWRRCCRDVASRMTWLPRGST